MVDPGQFFRKALSFLPPGFVSVDQAALAAPREFSSIDHLSIEAVAAYYQGLGALQEHGMYSDTKLYVRNVMTLRKSM